MFRLADEVEVISTSVGDVWDSFEGFKAPFNHPTDELKDGTLVGEDYLGNKYYENNRYFIGRNRWVIYGNRFGWDYEGSQVPPEWHRWLHNMTDETPITHPPERKPWMLDHQENLTLEEPNKYVPYSTTKPKIEAWKPK
nr:nadh dehydrogenase (ubiquinone) alpha,nadh dehydrogenase ubiquinone alpha subcomplex [Hymenolepis microstoma]